jgi:CubicO group peptidase (beta-lactamase class C family)
MSRDFVERAADAGFAALDPAVEAGRIPGAALGVVAADGARAVRLSGLAARVPEPAPLERETQFDLASLTKVLLTVVEILKLAEEGRLDLADPLSRHLPDIRQVSGDPLIRGLTPAQLLTHQAGLPAWAPIYGWGGEPATLRALILQRDWPVGAPAYSDIGFMILGFLIERLRDRTLSDLPLTEGLTARPEPARSAATEACPWRGRVLRGETHDENAFALGGVAGHAGLFGTVDGVLGFAEALMAGRLLSPAAVALMRRPRTPSRALAWQVRHETPLPGEPPWTGGGLCSPATLGHTGFTGTGLWIDWERGYAWAILTNRVHPSRHADTGIQDLRRAAGNRIAACRPD